MREYDWYRSGGWLTVPVQLESSRRSQISQTSNVNFIGFQMFYFCASSSFICQFASASLNTRRGVYTTVGSWFVFEQLQNVEVRHHWVAHVRSQWCSNARTGSACPIRNWGLGLFPHLSVAERGPATSSALVERVHEIRVIGFVLAGLCHSYQPISIIWILYNFPRHNDRPGKEWWSQAVLNFDFWKEYRNYWC